VVKKILPDIIKVTQKMGRKIRKTEKDVRRDLL